MRKHLLTGLVFLLPITITLWIIHFVLQSITKPFALRIRDLIQSVPFEPLHQLGEYQGLLFFVAELIALVCMLAVITLLGFLGSKLFFSWMIEKMHFLILKIPFISFIYKATRELTHITLDKKKRLFQKAALLEFPTSSSQGVALLSGDVPHAVVDAIGEEMGTDYSTYFVPTCPHPISGILIMAPKKVVNPLDLKLEEVFKFLVSLGTYIPGTQRDNQSSRENRNEDPPHCSS